jgi:hypothetical protein
MEGAIAASAAGSGRSEAVTAALLVGFDFAVREGFLHILGHPPAGAEHDRLAQLLAASTAAASPVLSRVLAAAWRAALAAVAHGAEPEVALAALSALEVRIRKVHALQIGSAKITSSEACSRYDRPLKARALQIGPLE